LGLDRALNRRFLDLLLGPILDGMWLNRRRLGLRVDTRRHVNDSSRIHNMLGLHRGISQPLVSLPNQVFAALSVILGHRVEIGRSVVKLETPSLMVAACSTNPGADPRRPGDGRVNIGVASVDSTRDDHGLDPVAEGRRVAVVL
jgi:hypothetical protein